MTEQVTCEILGRSVSVPDWIQLGLKPTDRAADLEVRLGSLPLSSGAAVFDLDDAVRLHIGSRIATVEPLVELGERAIEHYLIDHAIPHGLSGLGDVVLHGACLANTSQAEPKATVLLGPSGAGKSTLSLAMVEAGWTLLGDDAVRIEVANGVAVAWPTYPSIRLHADIFASRPDLTPGALVAEYANKRRLAVDNFVDGPCLLSKVVSLAAAEEERVQMSPKGPVELCAALAGNLFSSPADSSDAIRRFDAVSPYSSLVDGQTLIYPRTTVGAASAINLFSES